MPEETSIPGTADPEALAESLQLLEQRFATYQAAQRVADTADRAVYAAAQAFFDKLLCGLHVRFVHSSRDSLVFAPVDRAAIGAFGVLRNRGFGTHETGGGRWLCDTTDTLILEWNEGKPRLRCRHPAQAVATAGIIIPDNALVAWSKAQLKAEHAERLQEVQSELQALRDFEARHGLPPAQIDIIPAETAP